MLPYFYKSMMLVWCVLNFSQYALAYSENRFQRERYSHQNSMDFDSDGDFDSTGFDSDSITKTPKPTQTHTPTPKPARPSEYTPLYIMIPVLVFSFSVSVVYIYMVYTQYCGGPDLFVQPSQSGADPFENNSNDCVVINPEPTNPNK